METRHKLAEVIIAWAEGKDIQFRYPDDAQMKLREWTTFVHSISQANFNGDEIEWRIKPEKTVGWVNVYADLPFFGDLHTTEEAAKFIRLHGGRKDAIACIQIEYEEGQGL